MGIFSKLQFWKKHDDFDFDELANQEIKGTSHLDQQLGLAEKSPFEEHAATPSLYPETPIMGNVRSAEAKDLELISSKLDTLKAMLTSLDQRISNLEHALGTGPKKLW